MSRTTLTVDSILKTIADEKLGFSFGKPDRPSEKSLACILPILRETSQSRQYITYPETEQVIVSDSGSINKVNLKNTSKKNVFVRSGTIFEGKGTQSRALSRSAVLFPGMEVGLDVRCVHASHPISSGSSFKYGGITPLEVDTHSYTSGYVRADQHRVWNAVSQTTSTMGAIRSIRASASGGKSQGVRIPGVLKSTSPTFNTSFDSVNTSHLSEDELFGEASAGSPSPGFVGYAGSVFTSDNLKQNFDEFAKSFDDILSKARLHDNQAGLALITDSGCKTIEFFDIPLSWESLHKDAVKRMGTELLRGSDNSSVFEYKPENAVNAVKKVLALPFKTNLIYEHKPSNGEPEVNIYGLTASRYVGEVVELDHRVMHLVLLETA